MLTIHQCQSAAAATRYFDESLSVDDNYYMTKEVKAAWSGKLCSELGLKIGGRIEREQFIALLGGKHPQDGSKLSQNRRSDRRPCIDLTVSCPKSVSLAAIVDSQVESLLMEATDEFLERDVEPLIHRRVRTGKYKNTRQQKHVGKGVFAKFLHRTARPTESGPPDAHYHVHCLAFNAVKDGNRWFAAEMERIVSNRGSLQAKFEARLAHKLSQVGYQPQSVTYRQRGKGKLKQGWELRGIDREMIERHSKRGGEIEAAAAKEGLTNSVAKRDLAKKTRKRKGEHASSLVELQEEWLSKMSSSDRKALVSLKRNKQKGGNRKQRSVAASVQHAIDHCFERNSTVEMEQLVGEALKHGVVHRPEEVQQELNKRNGGLLKREQVIDGTTRVVTTTPEILALEKKTIALAKDERGTRRPINEKYVIRRDFLNGQQQNAVRTILTDRNGVTIVAGGAGTGKSTMLAEAKDGIEATGKQVFAVAPSTGAVEVLKEKGFEASQTAAHLIHNKKLQAELRGQMLFVDEASLLDMKSCHDLLNIGKQQDCRIVFIGDTRQHSSPGRGEGYRLIQQEAGLKVAKLAKVQRQKGDYKAAVETIAKGSERIDGRKETGVEAGFRMLAKQGKVHELESTDIHQHLTNRYFEETSVGRSAIIVAPTHAEGKSLSEKIRKQLRADGKLGEEDHVFDQLVSLGLTEAEKRDPRTYEQESLFVQLNQNVPGMRRGSRFKVVSTAQGPKLYSEGKQEFMDIPFKHPDRMDVYQSQPLELAVGDRIRVTCGGKDQNGKRIVNGKSDQIARILAGGQLETKTGLLLSPDHGHLAYAYTSTSFRAQGADADIAIAALSSQSMPAINARTLYVAASRGKKDLAIYCDKMSDVQRAIGKSGEEQTATELMRNSKSVGLGPQERVRRQNLERQTYAKRVQLWWKKHRHRKLQPVQSSQVVARAAIASPVRPGRSIG